MKKSCVKNFILFFVFAASLLISALPGSSLAGETSFVIFGSGNEGLPSSISQSGIYEIGEGATGVITIEEGVSEVTLCGCGGEWDEDFNMVTEPFRNLYIDATAAPGVELTLQDVYFSYDNGSANGIDFAGSGNRLNFEGIVVYDYNVGFNYKAAVHAGSGCGLTVGGTGTCYFYKNAQGAAFGGESKEMNGTLVFDMTGSLFVKGTKQGAVIGAGAGANGSGLPGHIHFVNGEYNLISNSRGAAIGGSAGSDGGSEGTEVYIGSGANININVDYSGAAVGGGGYKDGNDASGGTLYVDGGSLRVYVDKNAANHVTTGWKGKTITEGINDAAITAERKNSSGQDVCRLVFDTTLLTTQTDYFEVFLDEGEIPFYQGGLHRYSYFQEHLDKEAGQQLSPVSTPQNWIENADSHLYFYVTKDDHLLNINGEAFLAAWDTETETFRIEKAAVHEHSWDEGVTIKKPSCTEPGEVIYSCSGCGIERSEEIPASGHQAGTGVKENIKEDSYELVSYCSICGEELSRQRISIPKQAAVSAVSLNKTNVAELAAKNRLQLKAAVSPSNAANKNVIWKSSDETVAKVDRNGLVTAVGYGKAIITATSAENKKKTASCSITVRFSDALSTNTCKELFRAIYWAADQKITGNRVSFGTCDTMTRGQFVTFLWRLADRPSVPKGTGNPFSDIKESRHYRSILWAVSEGLIDGYSDGTFRPDKPLSRSNIATILWKYAGSPKAAKTANPFQDVAKSAALAWGKKKGIFEADKNGKFRPKAYCTRGEAACFLYRYEKAGIR